jgi:hypothetical protein
MAPAKQLWTADMYRRMDRATSALIACFVLLGLGSFVSVLLQSNIFSLAQAMAWVLGIVGLTSMRGVFRELIAAADPSPVQERKEVWETPQQKVQRPEATVRTTGDYAELYKDMERAMPVRRREPAKKQEPAVQIDWEEWVGKKLLQKAGILIVLIGMIVFLKYSFDNRWIDELGRIVLSVIGAGALLIAGEYFHTKYAKWSQAFTGGGLALLYLTVWVAHVLYADALMTGYGIVVPASLAFVLNSMITLVGVLASVRYRSQAIAWFTLLGGYLTPLLVNSPQPNLTTLLLYLAVLAGGLMLLAWHRKWRHINVAAFLCTQFYLFTAIYVAVPEFGDVAQVVTASGFFLLFNILPLLYQFRQKLKADAEDVALIILNAGAVFLPVVDALGGWNSGYVGTICFVLAAFYLLFSAAALRGRTDDEMLVNTYLVGTVALVAGGLFAELEREWVAAGWAPLSLLVAFVTTRVPRKGAWICSVLLLVGSLFFLAINMPMYTAGPETIWHPFTSNWALQSYVVFAALAGWIALSKSLPVAVASAQSRPVMVNLLHAAVAAIVFLGVTFEATGLDFTVDFVWTFAYIALAVVCIGVFFVTESIVWFVAALAVQLLSVLFIFVFGRTSGMAVLAHNSVAPFLHPWGYLSMMALLATFMMVYVARLKSGRFAAGMRADHLLVGAALAQIWVHVSVEISNFAHMSGWNHLTYDRVLCGWWIIFALLVFAFGVLKERRTVALAGALLLFIPFARNHLAIIGGEERMLESMIWTVLSLGVVVQGLRRKWNDVATVGMAILAGAAAIDMLVHLGDPEGLLRSVWWALAGLATMIAGFIEKDKRLRQMAMVIFGATAVKLLLFDFNGLETPVRILASIATGLLMIGASYLYQRFDTAAVPASAPVRSRK